MPETTQVTKVLFLGGKGSPRRALLDNLAGSVEIEEVQTFQAAVDALRNGRYDLVVSEQSDFVALERASASQQSAIVLETLGQGVCIVDLTGRMVWANPRMRAYPRELIDNVCDHCRRALAASQEPGAQQRSRHFSLTTGGDLYFEVTATPILDSHQLATQMAAVAWDITHTRRLQRKIDAIDLAGRELVGLERDNMADLNIEERLRLLEQKILRYMHELMHFDNFVVMLLDKKSNRLDPVLQHGMSERLVHLDIYASPEGNGISGYVAATGRSYICHDTSHDVRYLPGLDRARSSLTVPLRLHDQVVGVFNIESERPAAFNEDDRQFAEILGRYVAIALNVLDLLITERYTATGRLADDVASEIAAPLNDILANAATLMEEYIGHDDLRQRLGVICDQVGVIRKAIREVGQPAGGMLGRVRDDMPRDPLLDGKRVLVADDEEIIRETVSSVLTQYGCEVETASDGAQAVAMLERRAYDLVLADIKMPNKNGYEVFAAARDRSRSMPVILMTGFGYDPNHSIVRARREGLAAVLFKPFKVDQLLDEVRKGLRPTAE